MYRSVIEDITKRLENVDFARAYGAEAARVAFALALSEARKASGKTQEQLAECSGFSQPYIAKLEGGEANPTLGAIGSLLAVLGLKVAIGTEPLSPGVSEGQNSEVLPEHINQVAADASQQALSITGLNTAQGFWTGAKTNEQRGELIHADRMA